MRSRESVFDFFSGRLASYSISRQGIDTMKQGRGASSTSEVPRLFPRWSPTSTAERRWLLQHKLSCLHTQRCFPARSRKKTKKSTAFHAGCRYPGLRRGCSPSHTTRNLSAQPAAKTCRVLQPRLLVTLVPNTSTFWSDKSPPGAAGRNAAKKAAQEGKVNS